ncbi:LysR family transcriptional regulator [Solimonas marina]|uniref:LysR family transcriptional regulator n=1 Tax=Solimonas marina TaxID=2714601 RepID=A0A969W9S0_9GAMM|nr:LysR family transcriptional regulator [Solimonas marina]NKF22618.1 LysR family transcriptional regulator [Solimonas marina]
MQNPNFKYLYEAAKLGSMRAAADKLGVAVSSISRQIAQLEAEIGMPLIEHGRRSVQLTEAGELTIRYYGEQLTHREDFESRLGDLRSLRAGHVTLAVGEGFMGEALSSVLSRFIAKHAGVSLSVQSVGSSNDVVRMVAEDEAHLGLAFDNSTDPRIRTQISTCQPLCMIVKPTHPLASRESVQLADLMSYRVCLLESALRTRQMLKEAEAAEGVTLDPCVTSNSIGLLRDLLHAGEFVTLISVLAMSRELLRGEFVAVPIANPAFETAPVTLISRLGRRLSPGPTQLLFMLDSYLRSLPSLEQLHPSRVAA